MQIYKTHLSKRYLIKKPFIGNDERDDGYLRRTARITEI